MRNLIKILTLSIILILIPKLNAWTLDFKNKSLSHNITPKIDFGDLITGKGKQAVKSIKDGKWTFSDQVQNVLFDLTAYGVTGGFFEKEPIAKARFRLYNPKKENVTISMDYSTLRKKFTLKSSAPNTIIDPYGQ